MVNCYQLSIREVEEKLKTDAKTGLTQKDAKSRLGQFGKNTISEEKTVSYFNIFFEQFKSPLIYILIFAAFLVFLAGQATDALVIFFVLLFNAIMGLIQEGKSQEALAAIKKLIPFYSFVLREGKKEKILSANLVPGDILVLAESDRVSADARLVESVGLKINESAITGESYGVYKDPHKIEKNNLVSGDQKNMLFSGSSVISGTGLAIVVATGRSTEMGRIVKEGEDADKDLPLFKKIEDLSRKIIFMVIAIDFVLIALAIFNNFSLKEAFLTAVALSVSIVPEGLTVAVTIVLAQGVWRMAKKNAIIKKLAAVEALSTVDLIAVDKTGTVTLGEMMLSRIFVNDKIYEVSGSGYSAGGNFYLDGENITPENDAYLKHILQLGVLAGNAKVTRLKNDKYSFEGDPSEASLSIAARKAKLNPEIIKNENPRIGEFPFDYETKYHMTFHKSEKDKKHFAVVVGSPEKILSHSAHILDGKFKEVALSAKMQKKIADTIEELSGSGLRVLGVARVSITEDFLGDKDKISKKLVFVGLFGISDTPRADAKSSIAECGVAGIRMVMLTGDYPATAKNIASAVGIYRQGDKVMSGEDLSTIDILPAKKSELSNSPLEGVSVFSRITPEHKLKIVGSYQRCGKTIAMTGDGINDVPALLAADVGIAIGPHSTEAAKEASDIIILDDKFSTIISAIEEGRAIYQNIKKVVLYLFSTSAGEVFTILAVMLLTLPLPLTPAQIIWLNLVTDGFLVVTLAMEENEKGLMKKTAKFFGKSLVDRLMMERILLMGFSMMIGTIIVYSYYWQNFGILKAQTMALTTLAIFQWFNALNCRSETGSIFNNNLRINKYLIGALIIVFILQILAIYHPALQGVLKTAALSFNDWIIAVTASVLIVIVEEIRKFIARQMAD